MGGALGSGSSTIRRAALRTLRRFMRDGDSDFVRHLVFYQVAYFISRSLEKDKGTTAEVTPHSLSLSLPRSRLTARRVCVCVCGVCVCCLSVCVSACRRVV
jgi:hypothetical protein